jgi:hypothetical protein
MRPEDGYLCRPARTSSRPRGRPLLAGCGDRRGCLWALVFVGCGEFSDLAAALYHSAENYTTLGYGDVVMSAAWRLLGPLEAADGMLMFGVSTALIFTVINRLVSARLHLSSS